MASAIDQARATLLRALDELEQAEQTLDGAPDRVDLVVTYSIGRDEGDGGWHEVGGWASTAGPKWLHAAMLRRAADAQDAAARAVDDEPGEDEPHDGT
jgi:hypothetical protein